METCTKRFTVLPEAFDNEVFPLGYNPGDLKIVQTTIIAKMIGMIVPKLKISILPS